MTLQKSSTIEKSNFEKANANPGSFQKSYSIRYFLATRLLPKRVRKDVEYLYAFFRIPDEIIDTEHKDNLKLGLASLDLFEQEWVSVWQGEVTDNAFLVSCKKIFKKYDIPFEYSLDFLKAMKQDSVVSRYETYEDLEGYMYGSAGVVGCMLSCIFGFKGQALVQAKSLAYAMQMTNFLRDVVEDYDLRGRMYIPAEDMLKFGVDNDILKFKKSSVSLKNLIKYEVAKTKILYKEGYNGIELLSLDVRLGVFASGRMYERVLNRIENVDYDIFSFTKESSLMKVWYLILSLFEYYYKFKIKRIWKKI